MVATWPEEGAGTDCEATDPDCGVPRDTSIQLRFDRYLRPSTVVRQSIRLFTGSTENSAFLEPTYDLVERVVVFEPSRTLLPSTLYTVELVVAGKSDSEGFRAFDDAPLAAESVAPIRFSFRTREATPEPPPGRPPDPTCADALDGPLRVCANCHLEPSDPQTPEAVAAGCDSTEALINGACITAPRQGLRLDDRQGLLLTAIGRVAHQTEIGPRGGDPLANPDRVGVQMPIIDPGKPSNSYLMYKVLRNGGNYIDDDGERCKTAHDVDLASTCPAPSVEEDERLREWFVRLDPMPPPSDGFLITRSELDLLQRWIRALGAPSSPARCD